MKKLICIGLVLFAQMSFGKADVVGGVEEETTNVQSPTSTQNVAEADVKMATCLLSSGNKQECQKACTLSHDECEKHMAFVSTLKPADQKALAKTDLKKMVRMESEFRTCKTSCNVCLDTQARSRCELRCATKSLGFGCY